MRQITLVTAGIEMVKNIAKKIIPPIYHKRLAKLIDRTSPDFSVKSYSHEGEDMVLRKIFENRNSGFYVDVGAHHPQRFSNTCFFYELGWKGINIDPLPGGMAAFNKLRPRDINLEIGICDSEEELIYYEFKEPALNTFSKELGEQRKLRNCEIIREERRKVSTLYKVLDEHMKHGQTVDFLSIDVEGLEMKVLTSNVWDRYRPDIILIECLDFDLSRPETHPVYIYLTNIGYRIIAMTMNTLFFRSDTAWKQP